MLQGMSEIALDIDESDGALANDKLWAHCLSRSPENRLKDSLVACLASHVTGFWLRSSRPTVCKCSNCFDRSSSKAP
jgi:hypothetical protein